MKNCFQVISYAIVLLVIGQSCQQSEGNREAFVKLESLLPEENLGELGAVIIVPLENACSPCSISTLQQISQVDQRFKSKVQVVLTAKSFKLIDQMIDDIDLSGFRVHRDGNCSFWKHQMVLNSPAYYLIKDNAIVSEGTIAVPDLPGFVKTLLLHLDN